MTVPFKMDFTNQVTELLPRLRSVPLYRAPLADCGAAAAWECFQRLPFLGKAAMRENFPHNFLGADASLEKLQAGNLIELEHTSGTTSERLPVIFARGWWDEQESRALRLNASVARVLEEFPQARRATLTAPNCNGLTCPTAWMSREQRIVGRTLFVNLARIPFLLAESELERMAREIAEWEPEFLDVDPVHALWFARFCERRGLKFPSLKFILGSYEFVSLVHKKILTRIFGVPVWNLYGSTETGHLLMEDAQGAMAASHKTAYLEIVEPDAAGVGDLVVTTLSNDYMPLLRYRIGDLAAKHGEHFVVHGRTKDALRAADGTRVTTWQVDQCFAGVDGIAHYELRQTPGGTVALRYIADAEPPRAGTLSNLVARLESLLQMTAPLSVAAMPTLVPEASGKFRLTCRSSTDTVSS